MKLSHAAVFVALAAVTGLSAGVAAQETVARRFTETSLGPVPEEAYDSAVISPDGRRIAYTRQIGDQQAAVFDGLAEKAYDRIAGLTFSPDSRWRAYAAAVGGRWMIVVNGREQPTFDRIGPPVFGPHSRRLAYVALLDDGEQRAVMEVNQPPGKAYEAVFEGRIVFSPDGRRIAYGARREDGWVLVVDGEETGPFDFLGSASGIHFSPDGNRLAFAAWVQAQNKWHVVVDGKAGPLCDNVGDLAFSPDGKRLAYMACRGDKWQVVLDGEAPPPEANGYDALGEGTLQFSPDGRHVAYAARSGRKWMAVVDGHELKPYDGVAEMQFSPDSRFLAYVVTLGTTEMVVVNDRPQKLYDRIGGGTLVFSPNSQRLGYIGRVGDDTVAVVGNTRGKAYDMAGYLAFTPDSRHYVYAATEGEAAFTVVDGREADHRYQAIWNVPQSGLLFDSATKFHYLALKDGGVYLVEEEISASPEGGIPK